MRAGLRVRIALLKRGIRRRRTGTGWDVADSSIALRPTEEASMYRERRKQLRRRRRSTVAVVSVAVLAIAVGLPTLASADPVSDLLNNLGLGGNTGSGG